MLTSTEPLASEVIDTWLRHFNAASTTPSAERIAALFESDCHWRDLVGLTWDFGTVSGNAAVASALASALVEREARDFRIDPRREPPQTVERAGERVIEGIVRFSTRVGECEGLVRLRSQRADGAMPTAWTFFTALRSLTGHDEESVRLAREEPPFDPDRSGPNWLDKREARRQFADRDPAVLIVGGGHAGLCAAASLKALGVDTLVVDRMARVGDNWRLRYHSLKLHNQTPSNHMPYLPFPSTWPNYIPKDKIANWLEFYVEALEIDFWTRTSFEGASFDAAKGSWSARLLLEDGTQRVIRPRHIIMATSVSSAPKLPVIPTLDRFDGVVVHSSGYRHGEQWTGREVLVFGTGTSGHDIAQDLHGHGARVTMVQRSPTEVVNVQPTAQLYDGIFYGEGPSREDRDLISASIPLAMLKQAHRQLTAKGREFDAPLHRALQEAGFQLDFEETGWPLKYRTRGGGYYFNVGCSELIASRDIGLLQYADIETFEPEGLRLKDGRRMKAELIVLATGYQGHDYMVNSLFGADVASRVGRVWNFNDAQELSNMWTRTGQQGLWFTGGSFSQCRIFSRYLAVQIKAAELGLVPQRQSAAPASF